MSGGFNTVPQSAMDEAVAILAQSLWSVQVLKILRSLFGRQMSGGLTQPSGSVTDEAVAMVAQSLWSVQVLKVPVWEPDVGGL